MLSDEQEDTSMAVDTGIASADDGTLAQEVASMPPSNNQLSGNDDYQERIVQSIYDHIVSSIVAGYASNMHELMKTGAISPLELKTTVSRAALFPTLYSSSQTPEEVQETLDQFATEMPPVRQQPLPSRKRKMPPTEETAKTEKDDEAPKEDTTDVDDEDYKEDASEANGNDDASATAATTNEVTVPPPSAAESASGTAGPTTSNNSATTSSNTPGVDIWGRIPPKEPTFPVECTLCGRQVSTTRFASHLEKCLGLSTRPSTGVPSRASSSGLSFQIK